jgi:enoyl-CoA hydratase/carnithine racemase
LTLRIEKIAERRKTRIRLCGEFRAEHIDQVRAELRNGGPRVALDLEEVDLVDIDGVRFLNGCESAGVSVLHCSPYIREWTEVAAGAITRLKKESKDEIKIADQTEHRVLPRDLGRRLVLQQSDSHASGGWASGDRRPVQPRHICGRRRPPEAVAYIKRLVRNASETPLAEGLALERNLFLKLCISEPALARMRSYVEANITSPSRSIVVEGD